MTRWIAICAVCASCGGAQTDGGSSGGDFTGALTFSNASGEAICGVELIQDDFVATAGRLEVGESAELEVRSTPETLFVTACDGEGFAHAGSIQVEGSTYEFTGGNAQTYQERFDYLRELNRMNTNPVMQDPALQAELHEQVLLRGRDQRWVDEQVVTVIASDDWAILRNNRTGIVTGRRISGMVGHRFPDGHCSIQVHAFRQEHDGSDFTGVRYEGTAGNIDTGCSMLAWMLGESPTGDSSSASDSSSSEGCSNTCASANDGECDDGGPGSLYDACALGTDCADCGER